MTGHDSRGRLGFLVAAGLALFAAGAGVSYLLTGRGGRVPHEASVLQTAAGSPRPETPAPPRGEDGSLLPDIPVPIAADAARRAEIQTAPARSAVATSRLRVPGTVQPNQYNQVTVTPLVAGRVTRVVVELGDRVAAGAPLALIDSPELADAQAMYLSQRGELQAVDARLQRTGRLVEIGAASRQELDSVEAERTRVAAALEGARARLRLLGISASRLESLSSSAQVTATVTVPAPVAGVVTERAANIGLVVDPSTALFKVASLSPVWVVADVQEADAGRVRPGAAATVTSVGIPGGRRTGTVTYIAPDVRPETRSTQVRIEVPNQDGQLRFGTFVDVELAIPGAQEGVSVPAAAVQTVGARHFVYLAPKGAETAFVEREVIPGTRDGETIEIRRGLRPGDVVVTNGSFLIRAERERLGLRPEGGGAAATPQSRAPVRIQVGDAGFEPARVEVAKGTPVTLEFTRVSETTCAKDVVIPAQQVTAALPLNTPVRVQLNAGNAGEITFTCGMKMASGTVVVR